MPRPQPRKLERPDKAELLAAAREIRSECSRLVEGIAEDDGGGLWLYFKDWIDQCFT